MMIWYDQVDIWNIGAGAPYFSASGLDLEVYDISETLMICSIRRLL